MYNQNSYEVDKMNISVIIPCYNVEQYVDRAIESVINQDAVDRISQIICVNDASTDNTLEHLYDWESRYPEKIMVVDCEKNGGLGAARNVGISYATGFWVTFLDSDDWWESDYITVLSGVKDAESFQCIVCGLRRDKSDKMTCFDESRTADADLTYSIENVTDRKQFFHDQPLKYSACGRLINRQFILDYELYFPEHLAYEDIYWGSLLHMYVTNGYVCKDDLYHYYINPSSLVLKQDSAHHSDQLKIQELMWSEWERRGFMQLFREELECEMFYSGYLTFLKILALRYKNPQLDTFLTLQKQIRDFISEDAVKNNRYFGLLPDYHKLLLGTLYMNFDEKSFNELVGYIRKIGL